MSDRTQRNKPHLDQRQRTWLLVGVMILVLIGVAMSGAFLLERGMETDLTRKHLAPSWTHLLGTDALGRDLLARTLTGLSRSICLGLLTAGTSALLALILGVAGAVGGRKLDQALSFLTSLCLGVPHILLLLLISYACGKGFWGVTLGMTLSHWPSLSRVLRAEVLQVRSSIPVQTGIRLGRSRLGIVRDHVLPHVFPQFLTGLILLFPHVILHEASVTFLGFGLPPDQPSIGSILSESMGYLTLGYWWLALFPGLFLLGTVLLFHLLGEGTRRLLDPASAHL